MTLKEKERLMIKIQKRILRFEILTSHLLSNYKINFIGSLTFALHKRTLAAHFLKIQAIKTNG